MASLTASASFALGSPGAASANASTSTPERVWSRSWLADAWLAADQEEFKENNDGNSSPPPASGLRKRSVQELHREEVAALKRELAEAKSRAAGLTRELALRRAASPRATGGSSSSSREGLGATLAELSTELSAQKVLAQTRLVELNGLREVMEAQRHQLEGERHEKEQMVRALERAERGWDEAAAERDGHRRPETSSGGKHQQPQRQRQQQQQQQQQRQQLQQQQELRNIEELEEVQELKLQLQAQREVKSSLRAEIEIKAGEVATLRSVVEAMRQELEGTSLALDEAKTELAGAAESEKEARRREAEARSALGAAREAAAAAEGKQAEVLKQLQETEELAERRAAEAETKAGDSRAREAARARAAEQKARRWRSAAAASERRLRATEAAAMAAEDALAREAVLLPLRAELERAKGARAAAALAAVEARVAAEVRWRRREVKAKEKAEAALFRHSSTLRDIARYFPRVLEQLDAMAVRRFASREGAAEGRDDGSLGPGLPLLANQLEGPDDGCVGCVCQ